ncbi:MAG: Vms1/Ankzf1 family peptidyl-tRNA hydrolase [Haloarculaceae archaeon]
MLDKLLGRAGLRERIDDLEEEKRHLERQLEAEQERRADAASARQEAERQVNRLEDRVTELEDRVERLQDEETTVAFGHEEPLRGDRRAEVLDRLASVETGPEGALTAYVESGGAIPDTVRSALGQRAALVARAAPCLVVADDAGLVGACLSVPVPPAPFARWSDGFDFERGWFEPRGEYAVALVRSDLFALGEYRDGKRVAFHGFDADLKEQHSKGGFSQARFERLRDEQIDSHLERCRAALGECSTDRLFVVGEEQLLGEFDADATGAVDATGDPEDALAAAVREFWTVRLRAL